MTAVEYLIEELEGSFSIIARAVGVKKYNEIVRKSLEMEKQQIIDAYRIGECEVGLMIVNKPEQYYNETYGNKGSGNTPKCTCNVDPFLCQIHGTSDGKTITAF